MMKKTTSSGSVEMTADEIAQVTITQEDAASRKISRNIAELWAAADRYVYQYINGVGLSILAAGVYAKKDKAKECAKWSDSVWAEYYVRKEKLLNGESVSFDFSSVGEMPCKILELREEIQDLWIP